MGLLLGLLVSRDLSHTVSSHSFVRGGLPLAGVRTCLMVTVVPPRVFCLCIFIPIIISECYEVLVRVQSSGVEVVTARLLSPQATPGY